ncbi:MAG: DNA methyltransferase [Candidatus Helarchaeota archaeon]
MEDFKPIDRPFKPQKAKQWHFRIHPFFTKQASNVVRKYIEHFTKKGDLICDPFCGTGVTAIESLATRRKAVVVDIDPLAVFITRQTCIAPVDINKLQEAFNHLQNSLAEIVEFARKASSKKIQNYVIKDWYPKAVRLPSNSDFKFVEDLFDKRQLIVFSKLLSIISRIKDPIIKEQFRLIFSNTLSKANLSYMPSERGGKQVGGGGSSIFGKYRYWKPKVPRVLDVWDNFENRFFYLKHAKQKWNSIVGNYYKENKSIWIHKYSATKLTDLVREKSIDYIYTDPPYGAHIAYLDLSTMWNSWLRFDVTEEDRKLEIIEGGDIKHTKDEYLGLLNEAMNQMYIVMKYNSWLSLVFHHKEVKLWYAIRDFARQIGFEYVNTVAQPTATTSIHKKMNPLKVLGEQLIVNFRKSKKIHPVIQPEALPVLKVIYNAAEREIVRNGGATLEEIMRGVVPELFEFNLIDRVALRTTSDVHDLLAKEFDLGIDNKWYIKKENQKTIGQYIPTRERIRYYVISLLRREKKLDFDTIITTLMPLLENGRQPSPKEILEVLEEVAISRDQRRWELRDPNEVAIQHELDFEEKPVGWFNVPAGSRHNQILYRLVALGRKLDYSIYVGKREREIAPYLFSEFKLLTEIPLRNLKTVQKARIEGIDCIWFYKNEPIFAFEVEASTSILSGLERFYALLKISPEIGHDRRIAIAVPISRKRKLTRELTMSSYAGYPTRMEQKIVYIYFESLEKNYPTLLGKSNLIIQDIDRLTAPAELLDKE